MRPRIAFFSLAAALTAVIGAMPVQADEETLGPARTDAECYHGPDVVDCAVAPNTDRTIDQSKADDECWQGPDMIACARDASTPRPIRSLTSMS